jgi:hypothetical protein
LFPLLPRCISARSLLGSDMHALSTSQFYIPEENDLDMWDSDDGAPKVDYKKSKLSRNKIILFPRPPNLGFRAALNKPKLMFIESDVDSEGEESAEEQSASEEDRDEREVAPEGQASRKRPSKKQGVRGKGKRIVEEDSATESEDLTPSTNTQKKLKKNEGALHYFLFLQLANVFHSFCILSIVFLRVCAVPKAQATKRVRFQNDDDAEVRVEQAKSLPRKKQSKWSIFLYAVFSSF